MTQLPRIAQLGDTKLETLTARDRRLILVCVVVAAVSLWVGAHYYFQAFPEASIEFRVTRESSETVARAFLSRLGVRTDGYRHAGDFHFDDQQKTFIERELGVAEGNRLLASTVRLWRWRHRWFRPLQREEVAVDVTPKGEVVAMSHVLPEDAPGADLGADAARALAERFLAGTMQRPPSTLTFLEAATQKRPHRTDHSFTWKVKGSDVHGADYRIAVDVAGDVVTGYRESLHVPDEWVRGYQRMRAKNDVTGLVDTVFLLGTVLAMLIFLGFRLRRGDLRWRPAAILGATAFVLMTISELNALPAELYDYDTTTSFGGFLLRSLLRAVAAGLGTGVLIAFLTAAGEPMYRSRFAGRQSLSSLLRPRALRTREVFVSTLVGITLTCFFFAYENVFYLIANRLGAWAPREVPYDDLLSTAFPWVYVLFFGFLPAISEEFISRMFSIPFFEKVLRSTALAVVVSAFIWGFGHAGYPNQPFWIRGLEVGLAGIVFGIVLLRFGIVATVVCHFSVDALYTAFVLIRSPSLYYRLTGSLSAGVFLVVLLGAALAYWRRGGFLPAERTNAEEGTAPEPVGASAAEATAIATPASAYVPLPALRVGVALVLAALFLVLAVVPLPAFGDFVGLRATREQARATAARFLAAAGFDVSANPIAGKRSATIMVDRTDDDAGAYLLAHGGLAVANHVYQVMAPTPLWRPRFFVPGEKEEEIVSVDANTGAVTGFSRTLPETAPARRLDASGARALAEAFLRGHGVDLTRAELREQTQKEEPRRRDHTLVWEIAVPGGGEARVRHQVVVQGDRVGSWTQEVKIPETWRRERERQTALTVVLPWLKLPLFGGIGVLAVLLLVEAIRRGTMRWRFALAVGALVGLAALAGTLLRLDTIWSRYDTSMPGNLFAIALVVSLLLAAVGGALAGGLVAGLGAALWPEQLGALARRPTRREVLDALLAGLATLAFAAGLPGVRALLGMALPAGRLASGVSWPQAADSASPFLAALLQSMARGVFWVGIAAILAAIAARWLCGNVVRALVVLLALLAFLPADAHTLPEHALGALWLLVAGAGMWLLVRYLLRDHALSWVWSAWFLLAGGAAARLLAQPAERAAGAALATVVVASALAPLLWAAPHAGGDEPATG